MSAPAGENPGRRCGRGIDPADDPSIDSNKTALERAFELARSGKFSTLTGLRAALHYEGYRATQTDGPALRRQLLEIMGAATAASSAADGILNERRPG